MVFTSTGGAQMSPNLVARYRQVSGAPLQEAGPQLGCGLLGALGVGEKIEVGLDGVDAGDALLVRGAVEDARVVRDHQPHVGPSRLLTKAHSLEEGDVGPG